MSANPGVVVMAFTYIIKVDNKWNVLNCQMCWTLETWESFEFLNTPELIKLQGIVRILMHNAKD